jgi:hypothetical protein
MKFIVLILLAIKVSEIHSLVTRTYCGVQVLVNEHSCCDDEAGIQVQGSCCFVTGSGYISYNLARQSCCGGAKVNYPNAATCGNSCYDPVYFECCDQTTYDPRISICCRGNIITRGQTSTCN